MNKQKFEIERILSVSTSYIRSKKLIDRLSYEDAPYDNDYGCILHVNKEDTFDWKELSEELAQLSKLCRKNHCCWLLLDRDGPKIDGIKTYNW